MEDPNFLDTYEEEGDDDLFLALIHSLEFSNMVSEIMAEAPAPPIQTPLVLASSGRPTVRDFLANIDNPNWTRFLKDFKSRKFYDKTIADMATVFRLLDDWNVEATNAILDYFEEAHRTGNFKASTLRGTASPVYRYWNLVFGTNLKMLCALLELNITKWSKEDITIKSKTFSRKECATYLAMPSTIKSVQIKALLISKFECCMFYFD